MPHDVETRNYIKKIQEFIIFKNLQHAEGISWRLRYTAIGPLPKDIWVLKLPQIPSLTYPHPCPPFEPTEIPCTWSSLLLFFKLVHYPFL